MEQNNSKIKKYQYIILIVLAIFSLVLIYLNNCIGKFDWEISGYCSVLSLLFWSIIFIIIEFLFGLVIYLITKGLNKLNTQNNKLLAIYSVLLPSIFYIIPILNISEFYEHIFIGITLYIIISFIISLKYTKKHKEKIITYKNVWRYYWKIAIISFILTWIFWILLIIFNQTTSLYFWVI